MQVSIFIKSWLQDLHWLSYCLRFLECHWLEPDTQIVVVLDENCRGMLDFASFAYDIDVHYRVPWSDGYCHAMFIKTLADQFCAGRYILLLDSDTLLLESASLEDFLKDGKPQIGTVEFDEHFALHPQSPWKKVIERLIKEPAHLHYMTRSPILYRRETFAGMRDWLAEIHGRYYDSLVFSAEPFNPKKFLQHPITLMDYDLLGNYAHRFQMKQYDFIHESLLPANKWAQFHSWTQTPETAGLHRSLQIAFSHRLRQIWSGNRTGARTCR